MWVRVCSRHKGAGQDGMHSPGGAVGEPHNSAGLNIRSIQITKVTEDSLDIACLVPDVGDTAFQIHRLKRSAYAAVLRAFCAQSDLLPQAKEQRLAELRNEFKISDTEHREYLVKASLSAGLYKESIGNTEVMKDSLDHACVIPDSGDTAFQIHCLERSAYASVLRAFCAQSDLLSWLQAKLLTKLRNELKMSDTEHREVIARVSSNYYIKSLRNFWGNYSGLTKKIHSFDARVVVPNKIDKNGQILTLSQTASVWLNNHQCQQTQCHLQGDNVLKSSNYLWCRNSGMSGTSHSTKKGPYFDPHAVVPAKKLKSGNGSTLAYFKCPPCAEQLPVEVSSLLAESSIHNNPLDSKTSSCEMKAGCDLSPMLQEKHSQSKAGHVPSCVHQDMHASMIRATEMSPITKSLSVIIYSDGNVGHGSDIIKIHLTSSLLNKVEKLLRKKPDPAHLETAKSILKDQERQLLDALVKLTGLSSAGAYSDSNCQTSELLNQPKSVSSSSYEEAAPKPASSSSYEVASASTCASSTSEREEAEETKGARGREFVEPAAKRARRPTVRISGSSVSRERERKEWVKLDVCVFN